MAGVQTGDAISPKRSILGTTANGCVGWTADIGRKRLAAAARVCTTQAKSRQVTTRLFRVI